jgi:hypothetical protein
MFGLFLAGDEESEPKQGHKQTWHPVAMGDKLRPGWLGEATVRQPELRQSFCEERARFPGGQWRELDYSGIWVAVEALTGGRKCGKDYRKTVPTKLAEPRRTQSIGFVHQHDFGNTNVERAVAEIQQADGPAVFTEGRGQVMKQGGFTGSRRPKHNNQGGPSGDQGKCCFARLAPRGMGNQSHRASGELGQITPLWQCTPSLRLIGRIGHVLRLGKFQA